MAKKLANPNLTQLRKTLFELNIHDDLLKILHKKYFPRVRENENEAISVDRHMRDDLHLDSEVQKVVRSALRASGRSETNTKVFKYVENKNSQ